MITFTDALDAFKSGILAFIVCFVFTIIYQQINETKKSNKIKREKIRKLKVLKALEIYWIDNVMPYRTQITAEEVIEMNRICESNSNENEFRRLLKKSRIKYCYKYYIEICSTDYALEYIQKAEENKIIYKTEDSYD